MSSSSILPWLLFMDYLYFSSKIIWIDPIFSVDESSGTTFIEYVSYWLFHTRAAGENSSESPAVIPTTFKEIVAS